MTTVRMIVHYYLHETRTPEVHTMVGHVDDTDSLLSDIEDAFKGMLAKTEFGIVYPRMWKDEGFEHPKGTDTVPDGGIAYVQIVRNPMYGKETGTARFEASYNGEVIRTELPIGRGRE